MSKKQNEKLEGIPGVKGKGRAVKTKSIALEGTVMGRPSMFSQELADSICAMLAEGRSLRYVCSAPGMPSIQTIFNWMSAHPEFLERYTRAKQEAADSFVDEMVDLADHADSNDPAAVNKARLQIDTRKWVAAKLKPKTYGDKLDVTSGGEKVTPILGVLAPIDANDDVKRIDE